MNRLVNDEFRECADCNGVMRKLPGLSDMWMCERCSGVNYRLPEWYGAPEQDDEEYEE